MSNKEEDQEAIDYTGIKVFGAFILQLVNLFLLTPFVLMYVWNTLLVDITSFVAIGYGGAWILIVVRMLLRLDNRPAEEFYETDEEKAERIYNKVINQIVKLMLVGAIAYIVALSMGLPA